MLPPGGAGMPIPPPVCTPPVVLQPTVSAAEASTTSSGLSHLAGMCRATECFIVSCLVNMEGFSFPVSDILMSARTPIQ